ncbi:MAG: hypothetical protein GY810_17405 [Aureispira sp.]|nr:hypothetical protein [Aureispira sp.]
MEQNYTEDDFIKGIGLFGQKQEKKKLQQINAELEQEGFFEQDSKLVSSIQQKGEQDLRKNIGVVSSELEQEGFFKEVHSPKTPIINLSRFVRIGLAAACIILLIWVGRDWLITDSNSNNDNTEIALVDQLYSPHPDLLSESIAKELSESGFGGAPQKEALEGLQKAMVAYNNKDYVASIDQIKTFLALNPKHEFNHLSKFYLAISYMSKGEANEAIPIFEQLKRSNKIDQNDIKWYSALAYQQTQQTPKAQAILKNWQPIGDYKTKKKQLLDILQKESLSK